MWRLTTTIIIIICHCHGLSLAYKAAVVEYNPVSADTPEGTILVNLGRYHNEVHKAKGQGADVVVFPEYGLTTMVADPEGYAIEVSTKHPLVSNLSALALDNQIYLVVNLLEKVGTKYYNTNLVFNRKGEVLVKYRKINLFGEPNLTPGSKTQEATFVSDFGTTFGTFTCFDILYHTPSRTILEKNVTDVLYPTSWFSTMPFYASLSIQHGYASSTGVNLLASNLDEPQNTHGGSGIYLADGTSQTYIGDEPRTELIVKDVPKRTKKKDKHVCRTTMPLSMHLKTHMVQNNLSHYETLRDFKASDYTFQRVDLRQKHITSSVCHKQFCCNFEISVESTSGDIYKVMAYDGVVPFDVGTAHIRVCTLLACQNASDDSCGTRFKTSTKFSKIGVSGNLQKEAATFYTPLTLNYYLQPLKETVYCELDNGNGSSLVQLTSLETFENIVVYGIFGKIDK